MVKTPAEGDTRPFFGARWRIACGLFIDATNYSDKRSGSVSPVWLIDYGVPSHLRWTKQYKYVNVNKQIYGESVVSTIFSKYIEFHLYFNFLPWFQDWEGQTC